MKSAILFSLLLSSTTVFAAKEIEVKNCKAAYTVEIDHKPYSQTTSIRDYKVEVKLVQIKKALQKNSKFKVNFGMAFSQDEGSYTSSTGGETPDFSSVSGAVRENLNSKSTKLNAVEAVILKAQNSLTKDAKVTGSNLENLELRDIKSATVYPINAFQDEKMNLIDAKDASGNSLATILMVDDAIVLCK